jgi:hypothetical protein
MIPKYRNANEYRLQTKYLNTKLQHSYKNDDDVMMMKMIMMMELN